MENSREKRGYEEKELSFISDKIDNFFEVSKLEKDPAMSQFVPSVYRSINFDWENFFETDFVKRFNGLMIKGTNRVENVFLGSFPSKDFFDRVFKEAKSGDMLFLHHPINMECGDPRGDKGSGFLPILPETLYEIKDRGLSVYSCHAPMDYNTRIGTNEAIVEAFNAHVVDYFDKYGNGYAGRVCEVEVTSTDELIKTSQNIFHIPYVDFVGHKLNNITKVGIFAGGGGDVEYLEEMEKYGVQCGIAGEVTNKIDSKYGQTQQLKITEFLKRSKIGFIGLSHAGSEFLTMEKQMKPWFEKNFGINAHPIAETNWWR